MTFSLDLNKCCPYCFSAAQGRHPPSHCPLVWVKAGKMQHNSILMYLSQCDWNDCCCKAVCPPENSCWYLQSPLRPKSANPPRDILFKPFPPVSIPLLLPPCLLFFFFFFTIYLMSQTCFLFMTVDDWGAMLRCQLCSGGEHSRTWTNKKLSPFKSGWADIGGWVWMSECVFLCVRACAYGFLPRGRHLISAASGRKTGQYVGAKICRGWERITRPSDLPAVTGP